MKRRFAYNLNDNYEQIRVDEDFFKGYACFLKLQNIENPLIVNNGKETVCIKDNDYEWIEVYPENGKEYNVLYLDNLSINCPSILFLFITTMIYNKNSNNFVTN